ncbi:MAG TPA: hypothetical protein DCS44_08265 [Cyanobacteria bacterium UBA10660]|nr:MAG TPA: hypothetical protein CPT83_03020 [Candidatus Gastranaerophilales bacterium HUM_1]HAS94589.1 hypothetical protein [Cyanobacteria bacterium UBA10660]
MVIKGITTVGKWIDGKWVRNAVDTVADTVSKTKGRWVDGKWVKEATQVFEDGKVYTKMKPRTSTVGTATSPIVREVTHTRLSEGMLPEELTANKMSDIITARYNTMRHRGNYRARILSIDLAKQLESKIYKPSLGIKVEETGTMWTYRKPHSITENILDFKTLPVERVSMSVNAHPDIINVLDGFIARGEVIVDGKILKTIKPPKAYYKIAAEPAKHFITQSDPVTMYFREPVTKEQLEAIKTITAPFKGVESVNKADKMFYSGILEDANWLSFAKENTPEDLYKLFKRAQSINPDLAKAVFIQSKGGKIPGINLKIYDIYDTTVDPMIKYIENYRYRISAGQHFTIEDFVNDYAKAVGKTGLDKMI